MRRRDVANTKQRATWTSFRVITAVVVLALFSVTSLGLSLYVGFVHHSYDRLEYLIVEAVLMPLAVPAFGMVGLLIAWNRPKNRIGIICLGLALLIGLQLSLWQFVVYLDASESRWTWLALLANLMNPEYIFPPFALLLLVFPTGRVLSPGWRPVAWAVGIVTVLGHLASGFGPRLFLSRSERIDNPFTLPGIARIAEATEPVFLVLSGALLIASAASVVLRWRRASGVERQQLKWLAYVGGFLFASIIALGVSATLLGMKSWTIAISFAVVSGIAVGIPLATGIAILRYHLYDIDLLINRTLVYTVVMSILAGVYAASVILTQTLFGSLAGSSSIAVASSTLAAVALFQPLRTSVQSSIDRRFYRTRYDAAVALAQFGRTVRDEVDLERLQIAICRLATETMQPSQIAFWVPDLEEIAPGEGGEPRAT